jgi:hypothetical protein
MNEFSNYIVGFNGSWLARYGDDIMLTKSLFVATGWVNRHRLAAGLEPLDIWVAQELHWKGAA